MHSQREGREITHFATFQPESLMIETKGGLFEAVAVVNKEGGPTKLSQLLVGVF